VKPPKTNINQKLSQNLTLHRERLQKQNPNTYCPLLTPKPLQKTITPVATPNNSTLPSRHHKQHPHLLITTTEPNSRTNSNSTTNQSSVCRI